METGASRWSEFARSSIPVVEIPDDADASSCGRPDGERHAIDSLQLGTVRTHSIVEVLMGSFVDEMEVVVGEDRVEMRRDRGGSRSSRRDR